MKLLNRMPLPNKACGRCLPAISFILLYAILLLPAIAQENRPAPRTSGAESGTQQVAEPKPANDEPAKTTTKAAEAGEQRAGTSSPGAALAEASREAAGEEEENAQFKQSPSVRFLAGHLGLGLKSAYWLSITLNFAILALLIIWGLKKNLPAMFRTRTQSIQKGIVEARKASEEANRRLADIESRLARLDSEIAEMRAAAEQEAAAEEARIHQAAEEEKRKVIASAEQEIAAAAKAARRELKAYTVNLAVSLAERRIHVDQHTDQALVRSFVSQLGNEVAGKDGKH
jgi:F-type H+-transporting ATPase subunit b